MLKAILQILPPLHPLQPKELNLTSTQITGEWVLFGLNVFSENGKVIETIFTNLTFSSVFLKQPFRFMNFQLTSHHLSLIDTVKLIIC